MKSSAGESARQLCKQSEMIRLLIFNTAILMLGVCTSVTGQTTQATTSSPQTRVAALPLWTASVGSPAIVAGGFTMVVGRHTTLHTRYGGSFWRGVELGVEAGPGGLTARAGYFTAGHYDVPAMGWSADAVYVRPSSHAWGIRRDVDYIGPGVTIYFAPLDLSAAMLTSLSSRRSFAPMVKAGVVLGLD
jgi:hypothetical protein